MNEIEIKNLKAIFSMAIKDSCSNRDQLIAILNLEDKLLKIIEDAKNAANNGSGDKKPDEPNN